MTPQLAFCVLVLISVASCQPTTPVAIDTIQIFTPPLRCEGDQISMTTVPLDDSSFVGTRTLSCFSEAEMAGALGVEVTTRATATSLQCNSAAGSLGECSWDYSGLGGVDYTALGCGCFSLIENNPDREHILRVNTWDTSNNLDTVQMQLGAFAGDREVCLALGDPSVYTSVDRIQLVIDILESQLDDVITQFCCVPRGDSWHTVEPAGIVEPGDCSDVTFFLNNPPRIPLEALSVSYSFDVSAGQVTPSSLACGGVGGATAFIQGDNRRIFGSATVPVGQTFSCSFEVCYDTEGTFNMWLETTDTNVGTSFNSNANGPRWNTSDVCTSPVPSTVTVQFPPSTLPPTTEPPTTDPPTIPPPEFICIAPKVMRATGNCVCEPTFPCERTGEKEYTCDASDWYCIFLATSQPAVEYVVGWRDVYCSCYY